MKLHFTTLHRIQHPFPNECEESSEPHTSTRANYLATAAESIKRDSRHRLSPADKVICLPTEVMHVAVVSHIYIIAETHDSPWLLKV